MSSAVALAPFESIKNSWMLGPQCREKVLSFPYGGRGFERREEERKKERSVCLEALEPKSVSAARARARGGDGKKMNRARQSDAVK